MAWICSFLHCHRLFLCAFMRLNNLLGSGRRLTITPWLNSCSSCSFKSLGHASGSRFPAVECTTDPKSYGGPDEEGCRNHDGAVERQQAILPTMAAL
ncbi:hypothetical protein O6H91_19G042800 [Diphasiastrum complanatum]|uniref:Uncharacterized protein n=1 Tax=Diphasiastrum complanatum TaxID=34168 RepID=A0ACC2AUI9_DIPCM|nr:hypothetical protein O6H91_19G042800 [Diphasiastrum complanatum]